MLILRYCHLSSQDLITCERALLRFVSDRAKPVNLDFNVWDYTVPEIYGYILGMFVKLELVECLGITPDDMLDFIIDVDHGYNATYYHTFYHAADVTSVLYHMLQGIEASRFLSKPDMAALLLAGLCHDIGHPGLNNLFQVNANTEQYKKFGEESVLEKYSCSLAMDLIDKHALFRNIARSPTAILPERHPATERWMKEAMIKDILATDMSFHYDMLNNLNNLIEATSTPISSSGSEADSESESESDDNAELKKSKESTRLQTLRPSIQLTETMTGQINAKSVSILSPVSTTTESLPELPTEEQNESGHRQRSSSYDSDSSNSSSNSSLRSSSRSLNGYTADDFTAEQRQNLCNCLLHAADISNAVKPWTVCKRWSDLVVQEFFRQGDIEKAQHIPVSPNMDRDQHNQPQISLGFGDFVVQPYFEAFVELLPKASPFLSTLAENRVHWVDLQKSNQQFGHDPYMAIDPLEEPSLSRRPSSPSLSQLPPGRRVSVAAGVLTLDDAPPQRTHFRRLRHSTNTEATPHGHALRRIKRSLSGRSLSASLQNLHVLTTRSSSHNLGKTAPAHEAFTSVLKRQSSLNEKDTNSSFSLSTRNDSIALPLPPLPPPSTSSTSTSRPELTRDRSVSDLKQRLPKNKDTGSTQGGSFRQKRLASLQVGGQTPNTQQTYGDGYTVPQGNVLSNTGHVSVSTIGDMYAGSKGTHPLSDSSTPASLQTNNRSSTPAVMMNRIKYDWVLSPTLSENPQSTRTGYGPLDSDNETREQESIISSPGILERDSTADTATIKTSTTSPILRKSVEFALNQSSASSTTASMKESEAPVLLTDGISTEESPLGLVVSSSAVKPSVLQKTSKRYDVGSTLAVENAVTSTHPEGTVAISTASSPNAH
ncbi:hypothetical protein FBU30_003631 [Linnemannia zychae]|nr:hypothetical protein FBU30_003631 [Linnemannia zychae]